MSPSPRSPSLSMKTISEQLQRHSGNAAGQVAVNPTPTTPKHQRQQKISTHETFQAETRPRCGTPDHGNDVLTSQELNNNHLNSS